MSEPIWINTIQNFCSCGEFVVSHLRVVYFSRQKSASAEIEWRNKNKTIHNRNIAPVCETRGKRMQKDKTIINNKCVIFDLKKKRDGTQSLSLTTISMYSSRKFNYAIFSTFMLTQCTWSAFFLLLLIFATTFSLKSAFTLSLLQLPFTRCPINRKIRTHERNFFHVKTSWLFAHFFCLLTFSRWRIVKKVAKGSSHFMLQYLIFSQRSHALEFNNQNWNLRIREIDHWKSRQF